MPTLGEIARGYEIGRAYRNIFIWAACSKCGKERWVQYRVGEARPKSSLCVLCSNRLNHIWKGGQYKDTRGYVHISLSPNDFFFPMVDKTGHVLEHRLVMAKRLGRCLQPWEIIHHKNHIKNDNRDENLYLVTDAGHRQITRLETILKGQQEDIKELRKRITLLEAENALLKAQGV